MKRELGWTRGTRGSGRTLALVLGGLALLTACEETPAPKPKLETKAPAPEPEPAALPKPITPPSFSIDDIGPQVRFSRAVLTDEAGKPRVQGLEQLRSDLAAEKEFITGKEILLTVHRQAKPDWVITYLRELEALSPAQVYISTETRSDYPKKVEFVPEGHAKLAPCTLAGAILEDRGTAIWKASGGTARKRGRGMGGPDLTMTGDTIVSLAKSCDSDLFVVSGAAGVEWGLIYDLAASATTLEKANLRRAVVPRAGLTAGRPVQLGE